MFMLFNAHFFILFSINLKLIRLVKICENHHLFKNYIKNYPAIVKFLQITANKYLVKQIIVGISLSKRNKFKFYETEHLHSLQEN